MHPAARGVEGGRGSRSVTTADVREHYDALALIYRTFWGDHLHHGLFTRPEDTPGEAQIALLEHCVARCGLRPGARVFDVGCGHGGTAVYLASSRGCRVHGITLSEKQLRLASQNASGAGVAHLCEFELADVDSYNFPAAAYDAVWTMESSEHFQDKARYLSGVAHTLAPNGALLIAAWTGSMSFPLVRDVAEAFLCPALQTAETYAAQAEAAGLRVTEIEDLTEQVGRTWEICRERARTAAAVVPLLPHSVRDFVAGIDTILEGYRSRQLTYSVLVARKRSD